MRDPSKERRKTSFSKLSVSSENGVYWSNEIEIVDNPSDVLEPPILSNIIELTMGSSMKSGSPITIELQEDLTNPHYDCVFCWKEEKEMIQEKCYYNHAVSHPPRKINCVLPTYADTTTMSVKVKTKEGLWSPNSITFPFRKRAINVEKMFYYLKMIFYFFLFFVFSYFLSKKI